MVLERNERVVRASGISYTLIAVAVALGVMALGEVALSVPLALVFLLVFVVGLLLALLHTTEVLLTCSRVVEYRPLLARLARRFPALRPIEAARRQAIALDDVCSAYATRDELVLQTTQGRTRLVCHDSQMAFDMALAIEQDVRRRRDAVYERIEERRRSARLQAQLARATLVAARETGATRCVYCHGDFEPEEPVVQCDRCSAPHHDECMAVHGKCAVLACGGGAKVMA